MIAAGNTCKTISAIVCLTDLQMSVKAKARELTLQFTFFLLLPCMYENLFHNNVESLVSKQFAADNLHSINHVTALHFLNDHAGNQLCKRQRVV